MPSRDTFSIKPIGDFVMKYIAKSDRSVDPFARNFSIATETNDLSPETSAKYHLDAIEFLKLMKKNGEMFDLLIFDPPYSPRQISECYKSIGLKVGMKETQSASLYEAVKREAMGVLTPCCRVLSFGWSTVGMGKKHGFEIEEIMLVCHGGAHNDTICMSEVRI